MLKLSEQSIKTCKKKQNCIDRSQYKQYKCVIIIWQNQKIGEIETVIMDD